MSKGVNLMLLMSKGINLMLLMSKGINLMLLMNKGVNLMLLISKGVSFMPGLHSHRRHLSRFLVRCERDKVRTNVDIHTLVRELRDKVETFLFPLTRNWFTDIFPRALRWDKNRSWMWQTRRMNPSHSRSHLVLSQRECKPGIMLVMSIFQNSTIDFDQNWSRKQKSI